jgi:hypothetical protein
MRTFLQRDRARRTVAGSLVNLLFLMAAVLFAQEFAMDIIPGSGAGQVITSSVEHNWELAVYVQDKQGRRTRGAVVMFLLPPGVGTFAGGATSLTTVTDDNGVATARGFHRSGFVGDFDVRVVASFNATSATIAIKQTLPKRPIVTPKRIVKFGVPAAAVAAGLSLYLVQRGDDSTTITPGSGAVVPALSFRFRR